jgi:hypothetical protein
MNTQNEPDLGWGWGSALFGKHDYSKAEAQTQPIRITEELPAEPVQETPYPPAVGSRWVNTLSGIEWVVSRVRGPEVFVTPGGRADAGECVKPLSAFRLDGYMKPALDVAAETLAESQPTSELTLPQFGEMWRRNSDGRLAIVMCDSDSDGDIVLRDQMDSWICSDKPANVLANYTRVEPTKPGWRPIAEWDERDKSKRHLCRGASATVLATAGGYEYYQSVTLKHAGIKWFMELDLPEVPK